METITQLDYLNAWRYLAFVAAVAAVYIIAFTIPKYGLVRQFKFIDHSFLAAVACILFGVWVWLSKQTGADIPAELKRGALIFIPPIFFFYIPIGWLVAKEWLKESNLYRKHLIVGQKAASGRWGGVKSFFMRDCTSFINRVQPQGAPKTRESWLYLGKTPWRFDYQLGKRHIGTTSANHHILCSMTGGGKSHVALNNIVTAWNGGGLIFDPKGELYTCSIRFKTCPTYLFDPWEVVKVHGAERHGWNPLKEIDPTSDKARGQLQRLCEAIVFEKSSNSGGSSEFFKENGQMILRGFCAHILTAFPSEFQNLPAVYDIFKAGYPQGTETPQAQCRDPQTKKPMFQPDGVTPVMRDLTPEECRDKLLNQMLKNEAIGAAPRDAAQLLLGKDPKLKENFFSTVARAIDWCNDTTLRPWLTKNDFSMREIKTKEAFVTLCISEDVIEQQTRFLKVIYQLAGDLLDKSNTPNAKGHNRKSLFLFEEFKLFGRFKTAESIATYKRGSNIKALFVVQSLSQFEANYGEAAQDFIDNCDIQVFGVSGMNTKVLQTLSDALGKKEVIEKRGAYGDQKEVKPLLDPDGVKQLIAVEGDEMLFIPAREFFPMILQRVRCNKLFKWTNI